MSPGTKNCKAKKDVIMTSNKRVTRTKSLNIQSTTKQKEKYKIKNYTCVSIITQYIISIQLPIACVSQSINI